MEATEYELVIKLTSQEQEFIEILSKQCCIDKAEFVRLLLFNSGLFPSGNENTGGIR